MSDEYDNDNVVDLNAFREQKLREEEEKRLEKEQQDYDDIEQMRIVLVNIMEQLGNPERTGSIFYVPMTDDDYFSQYQFDSGYNDDGDWYSSWEAEGFNEEDYFYEPEED
tara:strand:+ start:139 stop:468 length:330 start_codon:yes stop_codon:yes gene_type:complete